MPSPVPPPVEKETSGDDGRVPLTAQKALVARGGQFQTFINSV